MLHRCLHTALRSMRDGSRRQFAPVLRERIRLWQDGLLGILLFFVFAEGPGLVGLIQFDGLFDPCFFCLVPAHVAAPDKEAPGKGRDQEQRYDLDDIVLFGIFIISALLPAAQFIPGKHQGEVPSFLYGVIYYYFTILVQK